MARPPDMAATEASLTAQRAHMWIPHVACLPWPCMVSRYEQPSMANSLNLLSERQRTSEMGCAMSAPVLPSRGRIARRAGGPSTRPPRLAIVAMILCSSLSPALSTNAILLHAFEFRRNNLYLTSTHSWTLLVIPLGREGFFTLSKHECRVGRCAQM